MLIFKLTQNTCLSFFSKKIPKIPRRDDRNNRETKEKHFSLLKFIYFFTKVEETQIKYCVF